MKRATAIFLALAMLLSLTAVAFANGLTPTADKTTVEAGDTLTVTYAVKEAISAVNGIEVQLGFNGDLFEVDMEATAAATEADAKHGESVSFAVRTGGEGAASYLRATMATVKPAGVSYAAGDVYTKLVVKAKQDIADMSQAEFKATVTDAEINHVEDQKDQFQDNTSVSVTVTPPVPAGYTVAARRVNGSEGITVGEEAQVALTVGNKDKTAYNAYDMTVTYDSAVLRFEGAAVQGDTPTVTDNGSGTLRITGYGEEKTCGTDDIVLRFTGIAMGSSDVAVTAAKVDEAANAITEDAPAATVTGAKAVVEVGAYTVTLPSGFNGDATTDGRQDYTFTVDDADNYDYTLTVKAGETDITADVTHDGNGAYTIPSGKITGSITVTADKVGKTRSVTVTGDDVTAANTAQYGTDYTFTVNRQDGYHYTVSVTIGGASYTPAEGENGQYTIAGTALTGDVVIHVARTSAAKAVIHETGNGWDKINIMQKSWSGDGAEVTPGTTLTMRAQNGVNLDYLAMTVNGTKVNLQNGGGVFMVTIPGTLVTAGDVYICLTYTDPAATTAISFVGSGAADVKGGTSQTATNGQDFTFSLNAESGYTYEVKLGEDVLTPDAGGVYTISGDKLTGTALTVTVNKTQDVQPAYTVEVGEYLKLNDSRSIFLVRANAAAGVAEGEVLTYNGSVMFRSEKYNASVWLVISGDSAETVKTAAETALGHKTGTAAAIDYTGDVNMSGSRDINDAQLVWNMYNARYDSFDTVAMEKFLRADVTGNGVLDTEDAAAVMAIINPAQ